MIKSLTVGAACALSAVLVTAAVADEREPTAVKAPVTAEQLREPQAVGGAYARLRRAAREACNSNSLFDRRAREEDRACVARALDVTVARLNQPLLTARHESAAGSMYARGY
jgi:UrcA family protein